MGKTGYPGHALGGATEIAVHVGPDTTLCLSPGNASTSALLVSPSSFPTQPDFRLSASCGGSALTELPKSRVKVTPRSCMCSAGIVAALLTLDETVLAAPEGTELLAPLSDAVAPL